MRFFIKRTGGWESATAPCEGAVQREAKAGAIKGGPQVTGWVIDLASLDDLITLVGLVKSDIIIGPCPFGRRLDGRNAMILEIYDDYRE